MPAASDPGVPGPAVLDVPVLAEVVELFDDFDPAKEFDALVAQLGFDPQARRGAVTDFIDAHYAGWHWPTFNVADIGIVCGVVVLLAGSFRPERKTTASVGTDA